MEKNKIIKYFTYFFEKLDLEVKISIIAMYYAVIIVSLYYYKKSKL